MAICPRGFSPITMGKTLILVRNAEAFFHMLRSLFLHLVSQVSVQTFEDWALHIANGVSQAIVEGPLTEWCHNNVHLRSSFACTK